MSVPDVLLDTLEAELRHFDNIPFTSAVEHRKNKSGILYIKHALRAEVAQSV